MIGLLWPRKGVAFSARNGNTGAVLAQRVGIAATRRARAIGLLLHNALPEGEGLWIAPSRGVHTWGMRFTIDVVALDDGGRIVDLVATMKPWRMRLPRASCVGVLELPSGTIARSGTRLGDAIVFEIVRDDPYVTDDRAA